MKKKTKPKKKVPQKPAYTHRDSAGVSWRMSGMRPVSSIADKIMSEMGLPLP